MNRKALIYSGALLVSLVVVSVLIGTGLVRAIQDATDLSFTTPTEPNELGTERALHAEILFPNEEAVTISAIELRINVNNPTLQGSPVNVYLPLFDVTDLLVDLSLIGNTSTPVTDIQDDPLDPNDGSVGTLRITAVFDGVVRFETSTLPGSTIPPGGGQFKGITPGAKIEYWIYWVSPEETPYVADYDAQISAHIHAGGSNGAIVNSPTVVFEIVLPNVDIFIELEKTVGEEDVSVGLTVTANPAPLADVIVSYDTAPGSATGGGVDYGDAPGHVTILANETTATIDVPIIDDVIDEFDETFTVILTGVAVGPGTIDVTNDTAIVTIEDDDVPVVSFVTDALSVNENEGPVVHVVEADIAPITDIVIAMSKTPGTATAGDDYGALNLPVTIRAGKTSGFRNTSIFNDELDERDETFTAELTTIESGDATIGAPSTQTITIVDNDGHPTVLTPADVEITEGTNGTTNLVLDLSLSAASAFDITVTWEFLDGEALRPDDYDGPLVLDAGGTVIFQAGSTQETLVIGIVADAIDEFDETFKVLWASTSAQTDGDGDPPISNAETVVTILDDDIPALTLEAATVNEGDTSYVVTVSASIAPKQDIGVRVRVLDPGQEDVATVDGDLTILAGEFSGSVTIEDDTQAADVVKDDTIDELDELFDMAILAVDHPGALNGLVEDVDFTVAGNENTLTVTDNDATPTLRPETTKTVDPEGDVGRTTVEIEVILIDPVTQQPVVSGLPIQFDYATSDGSATADADYDSKSDTVTIPAGNSGWKVEVDVFGDVEIESTENFFVDFSNGDTASGTVVIAPLQTEITIIDDDFAPNISVDDATVPESGGNVIDAGELNEFQSPGFAAVAIRSDIPAKFPISFDYQITDGSATFGQDYGGTQQGRLSFGRGQDRVILVFPINDDHRDEINETVNVTISNVSGGGNIADGEGVVTIEDNDGVPSVILLVLPADRELREGQVNPEHESAGQAFSLGAAISPSSDTIVSDFPIAVTYQLFPGSATPGLDFAQLQVAVIDEAADGLLTIPAGDFMSQDADFILVVDDTEIEDDENFTVFGSGVTSNGENGAFGPDTVIEGVPGGRTHLLTILDNDSGFVLSVMGTQVDEGAGTATVTVKSDRVNDDVNPVTVDVVTADGTAIDGQDYTGDTYQATIAVGDDTGTVQIPIIDDAIDEDLDQTPQLFENFSVTLSNQSANAVINSKADTATVEIGDNDARPTYELIDTLVTVDEGTVLVQGINDTTPVNIRLRILGESALPFNIPFQTADGTSAGAGHPAQASDDDFVHQQDGSVEVPPGATQVTATVLVGQDDRYEANENFTAFFPGADGAKRTLLIIQNDDAPIAVDDEYNVLEGNSLRARPGGNPDGVLANDEQVPNIQLAARNLSSPNSITQQFVFGEIGRFAGGFILKTKPNSITGDTDLTFEYVAIEQNGNESAPATVTIHVENKPEPRRNVGRGFNRGNSVGAQFIFEVPVKEGALAGEPDAENKSAVLVDDIPADQGSLVEINGNKLQPDGSFSYDSVGTAGDYTGNTFFTFRVEDVGPGVNVFGDESLAAYLICQNPCLDVVIPALTVNESAGTFSFDVTLTNGSSVDNSSAIIKVQGGSATGGGDDFTFTIESVSLNASTTKATYTVILHDEVGTPVFEGGETFDIVLSNAGGSGEAAETDIPLAQGGNEYRITITILDDEDIPVIDISDATVTETEGEQPPASVTVTVTGAHSVDVTVDYNAISPNTADAATQGVDYGVTSGTLTFAATSTGGSVSQTVDVPINDDTDAEGDEIFYVELTNVANALLNNDIGVVTIVDNEVAQSDDYTMSEDDVLTTDASTGVLTNDAVPQNETPTVNLVTDLQPDTGTLVLNPDGSFTYTPPADFTGMATFQYEFSTVSDVGAVAISSNVADVAITVENLNDDPVAVPTAYDVTPGETLQVPPEQGLLSNAVVTDIDGPELSVQIVQQPGHGVLNVQPDGSFDYTPAELTSTSFTFKIVDSLGGESGDTVASLNLPPSFGITLSKTVTDEDVDVQIIVTIDLFNPDPNNSSQVTVSTVSDSATVGDDVVEMTQLVELSATTPQQQIIISIFNDAADPVREGIETFGVRLENALNAVILGSTGGQRTDNVDIDDPTDTPTFSIGDATVTEGTGVVSQATVPVTQFGKTVFAASVDFATSDGTATAPADYTAANGTRNFPANTTEQTQTRNITIEVTEDNVLEGDETFTIALSNAQNSTIDDGDATVTIEDDEALPVAGDDDYATDEDTALNVVGPGVLENDASTPAGVQLDAVLVSDVSAGALQLNADGSFTYTPDENFNGTVTFTYKATQGAFESNVATVTLTVNSVNDVPVANDDFFNVTPGAQFVSAPGVNGIRDNDSDADHDLTELTFAIVTPVPAGEGVLQSFDTTNGGFTYDPEAFIGITSFTYETTDPANGVSNVATVKLGQIPSFTLTVDLTTIAEDALAAGTVTATITLNNPQVGDSTVELVTSGDGNAIGIATLGDDFEDASQTITLSSANTSQTVDITVNDDAVREGDEVFTISLTSPDANSAIAGAIGGVFSIDVTITDEEDIPVLSVGDETVNEGDGTVDVTVTLTGQTVFGASVDYATQDGSATDGSDYAAANDTIDFPANTTQASITDTITIGITDDGVQELDETFQVNLSNATGATIGDGSADVTITDNDIAQITIDDEQVNEGNGTVTVTIRKDIVTLTNVTVDLSTIPDSATSGDDFQPVFGETVTILMNALSATFDITIVNDALDEPDETFTVLLTNQSANAEIADSSAIVTILDDDPTPELSIDATATVDPEGEIGETTSLVLTITLSAPSSLNVSVTVDTQSGTATAGTDFTAITGLLVDILAGKTTTTVAVEVIGDDDNEGDETFSVTMSNAVNANLAAGQETTVVTIVDDDGEISVDVQLLTGFNLVGLPVDMQITSREIAEAVLPDGTEIGQGPVISVLGWNAATQSFVAWAAAAAGANIFQVDPAQGIFIRVSENVTWSLAGIPITEPITLDMLSGFNLVSVPAISGGELTSKGIAEALLPEGTAIGQGPVISVLGWNAATQSFVAWAAAAAEANIFTIDSDPAGGVGGYFVRLTEAKQLSP